MESSGNRSEERGPRSSEERIRQARERYSGGETSGDTDTDDLNRVGHAEDSGVEQASLEDFSQALDPEVLDRESRLDEPVFTSSESESVDDEEDRDVEVTHGLPPFDASGLPGRSRQRSFPLRLVVVGLFVVGGLVYNYFTEAKRDESGVVVGAGEVAAEALQVGDCLLIPEGESLEVGFEFESLEAVPCSTPHDMEVYASFDYPGEVFPGEDVLIQFGDDECVRAYEEFTGVAYAHEVSLDYSVTWPDSESWSNGVHSVQCALIRADGEQLTGSQQGQGLLSWTGLEVSSCYSVVQTDNYFGYRTVDCDQPHDFEHYASTRLQHDESEAFPGDEMLNGFGEQYCGDKFSTYVGREWELGVAPDFSWIPPIEESWAVGDRLLLCLLVDPLGRTLKQSYAVDG